jgi:hypothetical protein
MNMKTYVPKFAGSNIYWDDDELTFDEYGTGNTYYQGVYFKWGSLIGVSPAQTIISGRARNYFSSGTAADQTSGTTIYLKVNSEWKKTNVAYATAQGWFGNGAVRDTIGNIAWRPIPYSTVTSPTGEDAHTLLANPDFGNYKGDICNYLNKAYRMPTLDELQLLFNSKSSLYYIPFSSFTITDQTADGKTTFSHYGTFTGIPGITYYLPASVYRDATTGAVGTTGGLGRHWSGSATSNDDDDVYELRFGTGAAVTHTSPRYYGYAVRCVLQE